MPQQPTPIHPEQRVDIGALAAGIQLDTATKIGGLLAYAANGLEETGQPLTEAQSADLFVAALRYFDGFEIAIAKTLKRELERNGVATWGLPDEIEELLTPKG